jgi:hypothetical protein
MISLDALETGTYQFHFCVLGNRDTSGILGDFYASRSGISEFVLIQDFNSRSGTDGFEQSLQPLELDFLFPKDSNEVMLKDRIDPAKYITGFIASSENLKNDLTNDFRAKGYVQIINGVETIYGHPLSSFITCEQNIGEWHKLQTSVSSSN